MDTVLNAPRKTDGGGRTGTQEVYVSISRALQRPREAVGPAPLPGAFPRTTYEGTQIGACKIRARILYRQIFVANSSNDQPAE